MVLKGKNAKRKNAKRKNTKDESTLFVHKPQSGSARLKPVNYIQLGEIGDLCHLLVRLSCFFQNLNLNVLRCIITEIF